MKQPVEHRRRAIRRTLGAVAALGLTLVALPAVASGRCMTVQVPTPFVMPDGQVHAPGTLKLCDSMALSPVSTLHKVYVAGHPVGLLESRVGRSEGPAEPGPYVLFRRNAQAQLVLVGHAWPDGRNMKTYALVRSDGSRGRPEGTSLTTVALGPEPGRANDPEMVLVAAAD